MAGKQLNLTVRCGSRREWIDPLQEFSERIFTMAGFDEEQAYWLVLAVREAVMNAVLHGNKERPDADVRVDYRLADGRVEISVCDQGEGFDPGDLSDPLSAENLLSEGGRGVYLMRQFMDEVNFSFPEAGGTCISLVKSVSSASNDG
ncbi:MAG TPA: ATP-binding protein [Acidobacteriota bacterium]|nr:ATP-binding protein [Acidobacteriota bacterium]